MHDKKIIFNPPNLASKELTKITLIHHKMKGRKFEKNHHPSYKEAIAIEVIL